MRGQADAGVHHDGQVDLFDEDADHLAGAQAAVGADGRAQGHDGGGTGIRAGAGHIEVGVDVGQHGEAFLGQDLGGLGGLVAVGQQVAGIGDDFDLDPVAATGGAGQTGQAHGLFGGAGAGGVGQQTHVGGDVAHDALLAFFHAAHGHGDHLRAAAGADVGDEGVIAVFAGTDEQAALQFHAADDEGIVVLKIAHDGLLRPTGPRGAHWAQRKKKTSSCRRLTAAHELHDLQHVALVQGGGREVRGGHDLAVVFHDHGGGIVFPLPQQGRHGQAFGTGTGFAIDGELHTASTKKPVHLARGRNGHVGRKKSARCQLPFDSTICIRCRAARRP